MQVRLIVKTPKNRRVLTLNRAVAIVGRKKGCSVRIPVSDVSRRHCRIVQQDGFVVIEDLRSLNGTFVNGERISGAQVVRPGDAVEVGPLRFVVGYELSDAAKAKMDSFEADVELLPEDTGEDFIEDVQGVEWVEEAEPVDVPEKKGAPVDATAEDKPTRHAKKQQILPDDDSWVLPTDLQLMDLLEPIDEKELDI
jgi:predicted component of type VI protein secretion system